MRGPKLILVTDPAYPDDAILSTIAEVAAVLPAGALGVQLRDKVRPVIELRVFASRLRVLTRQRDAWLVINGDAQLAKDVGADGVHLGGGAMSIAEARRIAGSSTWISIAAHSDDAVRAAVSQGADAALVSPIFPTRAAMPRSETRVRVREGAAGARERAKLPRGVAALTSARAIARDRIALYALGGISPENARACMDAGADGIAVIRALLASSFPEEDARAFLEAVLRAGAQT